MVRLGTAALAVAVLLAGCAETPVTTRVERQVVKVPVTTKAVPSAELQRCGAVLPGVNFYKPADPRFPVALTRDGQVAIVSAIDVLTSCVLGWRAWAVAPP